MAMLLRIAAAVLVSAIVPAASIQFGGALLRDSPEPVDGSAKEQMLEPAGDAAQEQMPEPAGSAAQEEPMPEPAAGSAAQEQVPEPAGNAAQEQVPEPAGNAAQEQVPEPAGNAAQEQVPKPAGNAAQEHMLEPTGSAAQDDVLSEDDYRKVYEFDRDLVKEFESEQPNIDEVNVWASDEEDPKQSQAQEAAPSGSATDVDEYMRRKQDFDGLLDGDDFQEKKKDEPVEDAANQGATTEAPNGEQAETKADPWDDAGITHEERKEALDASNGEGGSGGQEEGEKEKQKDGLPEEDEEQKKVERLVDIAAEPEGERPKDGAADDTAFAPETTQEYIDNLPGDEDRLAPFPSLDDDLEQEDALEIPPSSRDDQRLQAPAEQHAPEESHKEEATEAPASATEAPQAGESEEAPTAGADNSSGPEEGAADRGEEDQTKAPSAGAANSSAPEEGAADRGEEDRTKAPAAGAADDSTAGEGAAEHDEKNQTKVSGMVAQEVIIEDGVARPTQPGCYVRTPKGCPKHPSFGSTQWKHEEYGEKYQETKRDQKACVVTRKAHVAHWCGSDEVHMLFVSKDGSSSLSSPARASPAPAQAPAPSGAAVQPPQSHPETQAKPTPQARQSLEAPTEPGCFVRTPNGCPAHPNYGSAAWKHEEYGEKHTGAMTHRATCEFNRRASVARFCGTDEVETLFVPPPEPGCYFRLPSGCPKHPTFGSSNWKHEEFGEMYKKAREDRQACEGGRKEHIQHWCGTQDVLMMFIPKEPESLVVSEAPAASHPRMNISVTPKEPGCWVRAPKGCPQQIGFAGAEWKHDEFAEKYTFAKTNRSACEERRKEHVVKLCGIPEVEMLFVPDPANAAAEAAAAALPAPAPAAPAAEERSGAEPPSASGSAPAPEEAVSSGAGAAAVEEAKPPAEARDAGSGAAGSAASGQASGSAGSGLEVPTERGCYVRTPKGCPRHPSFSSLTWQHEQAGERSFRAKEDRRACEEARKVAVAHWCGAEGVEMLFVGPLEPGCYVRTPSGCPRHPSYSSAVWKHEDYGEKSTNARTDRAVCETERKVHVAHWCGAEDVEMQFVPAEEAAASLVSEERPAGEETDSDSGAESQLLGGADRRREGSNGAASTGNVLAPFEHGLSGEDGEAGQAAGGEMQSNSTEVAEEIHEVASEVEEASGDSAGSEEGQKSSGEADQASQVPAGHEELQQVSSEESRGAASVEENRSVSDEHSEVVGEGGEQERKLEVTEPMPSESGCFVRTPSGCPNMPDFASKQWKHDEHAERYTTARVNQTACEVRRRLELGRLCGAEDVEAAFVRAPGPAEPAEPGCYYRTPAGCPSHPKFASPGYKHEEFGEQTMGAKSNRSACEVARKSSVVQWCGTETVDMLFVGQYEPGCYVRMPWGCPNHLGFSSITWKHDVHGEAHNGARLDSGACEVYRGDHIKHYCGTDEVEMMFVPAPSA